MKTFVRLAALTGAMLMATAAIGGASAQSISAQQRTEIERIVRDYLVSHPEVLQEAYNELEKRQAAAELARHQSVISKNATMLYNSPRQVVLGNPNGNVTMVEFFDYNCGYCKRAMSDMLTLIKSDPNLKVVLKEFPVLGPGSIEAAQVAAAVHIQDKTGKKYIEFHQKMFNGRGEANKARAMATAREVGLDVARIEKDIAGPEVAAYLGESMQLSRELGLNGTPSYVVGRDVVIGAVGLEALQAKINSARASIR